MRKIVTGMFISLDGVTEAPDQWQEHFDDEMLKAMERRIAKSDAILLGRVTYDFWHTYWPTATDEPFATYINTTPKYVVSSTLDQVSWGDHNNVSVIKGDVRAEILKLKQQSGKDIAVEGSLSLVHFLIENDLLNELVLMIHPVVAGKGKRLFGDEKLKRLKLVDSQASGTGTLIVTYEPIKAS